MNKIEIIPLGDGKYIVRDLHSMGQKHYVRCVSHGIYYWTRDLWDARAFRKETAERIAAKFPSATEEEWQNRPLFDQVWTVLREYPSRYSRMTDAAMKVFDAMKASGHDVSMTDYEKDNHITLQIDGTGYRISNNPRMNLFELVQLR